ncbi:MAG: galactose mutarotase [Puia sp.]|nr:galactose mutarotase [Puia sp.]
MGNATANVVGNATTDAGKTAITKQPFGRTDEQDVFLFTLTNEQGDEVKIINFGGIITHWTTADKQGKRSSVVIGYDEFGPYLAKPPFFGALVGRYANRIAKGMFSIDGQSYHLPQNKGENHLHGGIKGFDKVVWKADIVDGNTLLLNYISKDGEEGYPGNLDLSVRYTLTGAGELVIDYRAVTDKSTPVNFTNHSFFNLSGSFDTTVLDHTLEIKAAAYLPVDEQTIPTGEIRTVEGTPFDFNKPKKIGRDLEAAGGAYDHCYVFQKAAGALERVAVLSEETSGRRLEVYTTEPGMQLYTGNNLDGSLTTDDGIPLKKYAAVCLETQHFPDSPNQPSFPDTILRPGEIFHSVTKYALSVS